MCRLKDCANQPSIEDNEPDFTAEDEEYDDDDDDGTDI